MLEEERYMQMAIELATENVRSGQGGPFGAVIVREGTVIARGANQVTATNDPTAHAEVMAIRSACATVGSFSLQGATIYSSCEPCPMCLTAILWARLDMLYYGATAEDAAAAGFDDSHFYEQVRLPREARALASGNLLRAEAKASFAAWESAAAKLRY